MRIIFTLLIALFLIPFYGISQVETPVYNTDDVAVLKKIANENSRFIYRIDWLSDSPEWTGVTWSSDDNNKRVTVLDLPNSKITKLDVTGLGELTDLNFKNISWGSSNSLTVFNVAGLSKLERLIFNGSYIKEVDFSGLVDLKFLDFSNNELISFDSSDLINLEELCFRNNAISEIDLSANTKIKKIDCTGNRLPFTQLYPILGVDVYQFGEKIYNVFELVKSHGVVDFTNEASFDGHQTEFKWYYSDGTALESDKYTETSPGQFVFRIGGNFYCTMSNALFSGLTLKTSTVSIVGNNNSAGDIAALKQIAQDNPNFIYREDWLSASPEWKGVVWGGLLSDTRVVELSIEEGKLSKLDASALTELRKIQVNSWYHIKTKLKEVNLSGLEQLRVLSCSVNEIETLDLTTTVNIEKLNVSNNQLSEIDILNNPSLKELNFSNNLLTFSKLFPLKSFIGDYFSQKPLFGEMVSNGLVDLSSEADVNGTATNFTWFNSLGVELTTEQVETKGVGIFTFKLAGDFYCEMTNELFPDLILRTNKVTIKAASNNIDDINTLKGIAEENPKFIYRDDWLSESPEWKGVTWGGSLNDARVVKLNLIESNITNLDVSPLSLLVELDCSSIWSSDIRLSNLNIGGLQHLQKVICRNNELVGLNLTNLPSLKDLGIEDNNLVSLDLSELTNLESLRVESNELKSLDLTNLNKLTYLGCRYNQLTTLIKPSPSVLEQWYCNYNALSFSNLYHFRDFNQIYWSEQRLIFDELTTKGNIDYSSESEFDGFKTEFKWFHTTGTELTPSEIETVGPGQFTFKIAGTFYCEMTNILFKNTALRTKTVTVEGSEKNLPDIEALRQLAEENPEFIYRDDWLSEEPEWKGVTWGGSLSETRVIEINIENSKLIDVDISLLKDLRIVKLDFSSIKTLNISELNKLKELDCSHNSITELNLSSAQNIEKLNCSYNLLSQINISALTSLVDLSCASNNIRQIDISKNLNLTRISCHQNQLRFSVLAPLLNIETHALFNQTNVFDSIESDGIIDYSQEAIINGTNTEFKWFKTDDTELNSEEVEITSSGVFLFKIAGEFYCEMTNALFPDLTLKTNKVTIKSGSYNEDDVAVLKKIAQDNADFVYREDWLSEAPEWKGVKWGGSLSDSKVVELDFSNGEIAILNLSPLNELVKINVTSSSIQSLNISGLENLKELNCSANLITELDLSSVKKLEKLDCSGNQLSQIDLSSISYLNNLDCQSNNLTQLDCSQNPNLSSVYCYSNRLKFSDLAPLLNVDIHNLFNQYKVFEEIESNGIIDYSSEAVINGTNTEFTWFRTDDTELSSGEVEMTSPGVFLFKNVGDYYCKMSNGLFGENVLRTKVVHLRADEYNAEDVATLRKIAQDNLEFTHREDWLSDTPEWKSVTWGGDLTDMRVIELNLYQKNISILNVVDLEELQSLTCSGWSSSFTLNELNVSGLNNLKYLSVNDNELTQLDLSSLIDLEKLYCSGNSLTEIDISASLNLIELNCSNNKLTKIDVSKNTKLKSIDCSSNFLSFEDLYPLLDLECFLTWEQNPLFDEMESTGFVDYSSQADVNGTATTFTWFNTVGQELSSSEVETINPGQFSFKIAGEFYCEMTNALLPELTLKTNKLTVKGTGKNIDDVNSLKKIAQDNPKFIHRDDWLSDNPEWTGVKWGGSITDTRVVKLVLNKAQIASLDVNPFSDLQDLDCSWGPYGYGSWETKLTSLNFNGLHKLVIVNCSNQKISELTLSDLPLLEELNCSYNNIASLDLTHLNQLKSISCHNNKLAQILVVKDNQIADLDCRSNQLPLSKLYLLRDILELRNSDQYHIATKVSEEAVVDFSSEIEFDGFKTNFKWYHSNEIELNSDEIEEIAAGQFKFKIAGKFYCEMTNDAFTNLTVKTETITVESANKNQSDIDALTQIAEINEEFIYREDWLSDAPEWKGITWGGSLTESRVIEFNIDDSKLTNLDLSALKELRKVRVTNWRVNQKLIELNVSGLIQLKDLNCSENDLESLDMSSVPNIEVLNCMDNELDKIDISNNPKLLFINCQSNRLSYSQLFPLLSIDSYYFTYQSEIFETMESIGIVDYTAEAEFDGIQTIFKWYNSFGSELTEDDIEVLEPGKFNFKIGGEFYCEMTNTLFDNITLKTNFVTITGVVDPNALNKYWIRKNNFDGGARQGAVGFSIGNYGYLGLGENGDLLKDFWRYDSRNDSWWKIGDSPLEARRDAIGFAVSGKGYIGLGKNETDKFTDFWEFNTDNSTWTHVTDYPGQNTDLASWVVHNNKVYFFCGREETGAYSNEVWEYDPSENVWSRKNDFPGDKRIFSVAYSLNGRIYMGNGQNYENGTMMTNDLWEYTPETDTWIEQDMLLGYTTMSPSYFSIGDKAYYGLSGFSSGSFYQLDPVKEEFEESVFPYVESGKNLNQPVIFVINKQAYVCTGYQKEGFYDETNIAEVIVFDPPAPPVVKVQNFVATLADDFKVKLEWEDMSVSEIRQEILYSKDGENFDLLATINANSESFVSQDLEPNTNYWFKIRVVGKWDDSFTSDMVNISTLTLPVSEPTEFKAELFDHLKVKLAWLDNSRAEQYQQVMISEDKETWNAIDIAADLESYTTDYLKAETTYYFKIKSIDKNDNAEESEILSVITLTATVASPTEFQAEVFDYLKVKLLWKDNSRADQSQEIMVSEDKEVWDIIDIDANIETYTTEYLKPETTYYFRLKSIGVDGDLAETDIVSVTLGDNVFISATNITANLASDLEVKLDWQINSIAGVSQYIMISQDGENYTQHAEISADATTYTTAELKSATSYYFKIMTKFDYHESLISENAEVTTNLVVGIEEIREDEINIYPNPTSDYLRLELPGSDLKKVRILDGKGQVIFVKEVINNLTIDVNGFAAGVYFVQIYCDQFSTTKKIVVL